MEYGRTTLTHINHYRQCKKRRYILTIDYVFLTNATRLIQLLLTKAENQKSFENEFLTNLIKVPEGFGQISGILKPL